MKVVCQSPVDHDGKSYGVGQTISKITDEQAQALIAAGAAIELVEEVKPAKGKADADQPQE